MQMQYKGSKQIPTNVIPKACKGISDEWKEKKERKKTSPKRTKDNMFTTAG